MAGKASLSGQTPTPPHPKRHTFGNSLSLDNFYCNSFSKELSLTSYSHVHHLIDTSKEVGFDIQCLNTTPVPGYPEQQYMGKNTYWYRTFCGSTARERLLKAKSKLSFYFVAFPFCFEDKQLTFINILIL